MRSRRDVRAGAVARSMGGGRGDLILCLVCERKLPRDAIYFIARKPVPAGHKHQGKPVAVCGQCWHGPGGVADLLGEIFS